MFVCQALLTAVSFGCTSVKVHGEGLPPVTLRTMELGAPPGLMNWRYSWYPVGQSNYGNNSFGYFALESGDKSVYADGMNEVGLSVSALTFRESVYQPTPSKKDKKAHPELPYRFLLQYLLGSAANTSHAIQLVNDVTVTKGGQEIPELYVHWSITDKYNTSYILEYVKGEAVWHKDLLGVLTNDPDYSWHISNLNNFVALSPYLPNAGPFVGDIPNKNAFGTNLLGLPGDLSPPARFVRMFYLREFAMSRNYPTTLSESISLATGLANTVHIIKGVVGKDANSTAPEATYWSVLKIPALRQVYFRSYEDMQWRLVDISKLSGSKKQWSHYVETGAEGIKNITGQLLE